MICLLIPGPPYLIPADVCVPKLRSNSVQPLSSIKTYHYQAQLKRESSPNERSCCALCVLVRTTC